MYVYDMTWYDYLKPYELYISVVYISICISTYSNAKSNANNQENSPPSTEWRILPSNPPPLFERIMNAPWGTSKPNLIPVS